MVLVISLESVNRACRTTMVNFIRKIAAIEYVSLGTLCRTGRIIHAPYGRLLT